MTAPAENALVPLSPFHSIEVAESLRYLLERPREQDFLLVPKLQLGNALVFEAPASPLPLVSFPRSLVPKLHLGTHLSAQLHCDGANAVFFSFPSSSLGMPLSSRLQPRRCRWFPFLRAFVPSCLRVIYLSLSIKIRP